VTRFLAALVERHRADHAVSVPRLEPRIPSRFEPVPGVAEPARAVPDLVIDVARDAEVTRPHERAHAPHPSRTEVEPFEDGAPRLTALTSALGTARTTVAVAVPAMPPAAPESAPARAARAARIPAYQAERAETRDESRAGGAQPERPRRTFLEPPPARRPAPSVSTSIRAERERTAPPEPPTVHVSIGRVDVRAIVAPPPARPPAPATRPSLEDYLRGRQGGAR
jgi:hypothetical protein